MGSRTSVYSPALATDAEPAVHRPTRSELRMWEFNAANYKNPNLEELEAAKLVQFSPTSCYVVQHLYRQKTASAPLEEHVEPTKSAPRDGAVSAQTLLTSAAENLDASSLALPIADTGLLPPPLYPLAPAEGDPAECVATAFYLWRGRRACGEVEAAATAYVFRVSARAPAPEIRDGLVSFGSVFADDLPHLGGDAPDDMRVTAELHTNDLARRLHLARCFDIFPAAEETGPLKASGAQLHEVRHSFIDSLR
eukprot:gnl/Chilomastix_cuspidata/5403.p1 GENE.gnl/Chilomastix_cuspidata/5403~~gnl/Chilomastix_cuspidata/5403.p1  ORF type:complete len:252 (-),score=35.02 gnl/Chilomastix_cuspidata/5403:13-768(-)